MRAILLARVSTDEQSTEQQIPRLIEYAKSNNLEYSDKDIFDISESAYKGNRKKFEEVLKTIEETNETVALVTDKIDRLLRDFNRYLPLFDDLRKREKVQLHFPSDNLILRASSPAVDLFKFSMGVALAQYYSDSIRDNVKRRFEQKMRNGELLTKAPYGYNNITINDKEKTVEVNYEESLIVKKMYELYATNSYSDRTLRKKILELFNVEFAGSQIARILTNKFYIGIILYQKKNIEYPHCYETIISEDLFNRVQEIREGRLQNKNKGKYAGKPFKYRRLIRCAICGYSMCPEEHNGKNSYCCTEYKGKHGAKYVSEEELTKQFAEAFDRIRLTGNDAEKILNDLKSINETNLDVSISRVRNLRREQERYSRMKSKNYDLYVDGSITSSFYEEKAKEYDKLYKEVTDKIRSSEQTEDSFYITAKYVLELAKHSRELFENALDEERAVLINTVLLNIRWDGKNLLYDYLKPFDLLVDFKKLRNGVEDGI